MPCHRYDASCANCLRSDLLLVVQCTVDSQLGQLKHHVQQQQQQQQQHKRPSTSVNVSLSCYQVLPKGALLPAPKTRYVTSKAQEVTCLAVRLLHSLAGAAACC